MKYRRLTEYDEPIGGPQGIWVITLYKNATPEVVRMVHKLFAHDTHTFFLDENRTSDKTFDITLRNHNLLQPRPR